ncbi:hypothetical protein ACT4EA_004172 [Escherichia coli]
MVSLITRLNILLIKLITWLAHASQTGTSGGNRSGPNVKEIKMAKECFWIPGAAYMLEFVIVRDGIRRGMFSDKTLQEMQSAHPDVTIIDQADFFDRLKELASAPVMEITAGEYAQAQAVALPSGNYFHRGSASFRQPFVRGVDRFFVRLRLDGWRYFRFRASSCLTHEDAVIMVMQALDDKASGRKLRH